MVATGIFWRESASVDGRSWCAHRCEPRAFEQDVTHLLRGVDVEHSPRGAWMRASSMRHWS